MLLAPCPPHTLTHPPPVRLSVHPLIPLRVSDVPPSPRLWGWLHMCCPRRLVMLVLTAPISVTANYVAVTASSHLRTATPPAIRPLSLSTSGGGFEWLPQTLQRHKAYSGCTSAERDRFSKRCKGYCTWENTETWRRDVRCAAELGSLSVFGDLMRE